MSLQKLQRAKQKYPDSNFEFQGWQQGARLIAGVDEVGRGPLAGPLLAAAVVFPAYTTAAAIPGLRDSKMMSSNARSLVSSLILDKAIGIGLGQVLSLEIDTLGISASTHLAMRRAIDNIPFPVDYLLIDAVDLDDNHIPGIAITHGDSISISIAAASVIAKVTRDTLMQSFALKYPGYGFERHKGYPTKEHIHALYRLGPSTIHRKSFKPIRAIC